MSNQTLQRSSTKRRARKKSAQGAKSGSSFRRQTARLDGRRDGTPLIFGWGKHLTRMQKQKIQRRAAFGFVGVVIFAVILVFVFGLIQQNIIIPNEAVVTVNGTGITQDTYRKQLAYDAQDLWNLLQSEIKQQATYQAQAQKGDSNATTQNAILTEQIQTNESNYQQAQITQSAINELVEDRLIRQGDKTLEQQNHVSASVLEPGDKAITDALNAFKKAFPANETYASFLQKNHLTEADVRAAIAVHLRRDLLQTYLSSQLVSPARQAHLRRIQTNTIGDAQRVLTQIQKNPNDSQLWTTLAKKDSLDANSKNTGGDMGWVPHGTGDSAIDNWAYAPGRKVGDLTSPPLKDASGTYDVVQVLGFDPSRVIDPTTLKAAQDNALSHWLEGVKADPATHITTPDSTMLGATRNLPVVPDLNAQLPQESPQGPSGSGTGLPGLPPGGSGQP